VGTALVNDLGPGSKSIVWNAPSVMSVRYESENWKQDLRDSGGPALQSIETISAAFRRG